MATWIWIIIAAAVVVGLIAVAAWRRRHRQLQERREQAHDLRQQAQHRHSRAKERETMAEELVERAKAERKEGDKAAAQAAEVDPDREAEAQRR